MKIVKSDYRTLFICTLTNCLKAEIIGADDDFINKKLKEFIIEED